VQTELDGKEAEVQKQAAALAQKTTELSEKEVTHEREKAQSAEQSAKQIRLWTEKAQTLQAIIVAMRAELVASSRFLTICGNQRDQLAHTLALTRRQCVTLDASQKAAAAISAQAKITATAVAKQASDELVASSRFLTICENQRDQLAHNLALTRRQCVTLDASQKAAAAISAQATITATAVAKQAYDALEAQKQALETTVTTLRTTEAALRRMLTEAGQVIKKLSRDVTLSSAERERLARESAQTRASLVREHARHLVENRTLAVRCGDSDRNLEQKEEQNTQLSTQNQTLLRMVTALGTQLITSEYYLTLSEQARDQVVRELVKTRLKCVEWNAKCKKVKKIRARLLSAKLPTTEEKADFQPASMEEEDESASDLTAIQNFAEVWCQIDRIDNIVAQYRPTVRSYHNTMTVYNINIPQDFELLFQEFESAQILLDQTRSSLIGMLQSFCNGGKWNDNALEPLRTNAGAVLLQSRAKGIDSIIQRTKAIIDITDKRVISDEVLSRVALLIGTHFITDQGNILDPAAVERVKSSQQGNDYFTGPLSTLAYDRVSSVLEATITNNMFTNERARNQNAAAKVGMFMTCDAQEQPLDTAGSDLMRTAQASHYFDRSVTVELYQHMRNIMDHTMLKNTAFYMQYCNPAFPVEVVGREMLISKNEWIDPDTVNKVTQASAQELLKFMQIRMDHLMRINSDPFDQLASQAVGRVILSNVGISQDALKKCLKENRFANCGLSYLSTLVNDKNQTQRLFRLLLKQDRARQKSSAHQKESRVDDRSLTLKPESAGSGLTVQPSPQRSPPPTPKSEHAPSPASSPQYGQDGTTRMDESQLSNRKRPNLSRSYTDGQVDEAPLSARPPLRATRSSPFKHELNQTGDGPGTDSPRSLSAKKPKLNEQSGEPPQSPFNFKASVGFSPGVRMDPLLPLMNDQPSNLYSQLLTHLNQLESLEQRNPVSATPQEREGIKRIHELYLLYLTSLLAALQNPNQSQSEVLYSQYNQIISGLADARVTSTENEQSLEKAIEDIKETF
jgi:hypothetical protein